MKRDKDGRIYVTDRIGQTVRAGDEVWFWQYDRMYTGTVLVIGSETNENTVAIGSVIGAMFRQPDEIEKRPRFA